jgi:serine protease Do
MIFGKVLAMETESSNMPEQNPSERVNNAETPASNMQESEASATQGMENSNMQDPAPENMPESDTSKMPESEPTPLPPQQHMMDQPASEPPSRTRPGKQTGSGNRALVTVLIVILALATVGNGALAMQSSSKVNSTNADVTAAQSANSSLQASIAQQQTTANTLSTNIAGLQTTVSKLTGTTAPPPATTDFITPAKMIEPQVVYIEVIDRTGGGSGSGTIIRSDGYVLTNQHVVAGATSITVFLKTGEKFTATLINSNADLDAAIIKINTTRTDLPTVTMGSSASVVIGQEILTCGFPLGTDLFGNAAFGPATFNAGVVSAIRNLPSANTDNPAVTLNYIQIDADINPGNSGGGLFTLDGKLIGIPAYGFATGINAAIPIDAIQSLIQSSVK